MNWLKFFVKKAFWLNVGIIFLILIFILITVFFSIKSYTRHGKTFPLPDFKGLTESQFQNFIKKNDLRYIIIDSLYLDDVPKGTVVEQVPKAGEHVKKNRKIFFTINSWTEEQVLVPNIMDYSLRNAKVMLESYGLTLGELIYIPSEYANLVLGQLLNGKHVEPGIIVKKGTTIDLLIGRGLGSDITPVPRLIGLEKNEAEHIVQRVFLFLGAVIYDQTVKTTEDTLRAVIWKQNPRAKPNEVLNLGASIDIWLTTDESLINLDEWENDEEDAENEFRNELL